MLYFYWIVVDERKQLEQKVSRPATTTRVSIETLMNFALHHSTSSQVFFSFLVEFSLCFYKKNSEQLKVLYICSLVMHQRMYSVCVFNIVVYMCENWILPT